MKLRMMQLVEQRQNQIIEKLCALNKKDAIKDTWKREGGGGGITGILPQGRVFESGGVNSSCVYGNCSQQLLNAMDLEEEAKTSDLQFFATGISLILHPHNPMVPTVHANYRYFELTRKNCDTPIHWWFGGGSDLTPSYLFEEDGQHFHLSLKKACDQTDTALYPKLKKECDDYFYLPHRKEHRGIGGIFSLKQKDRLPEQHFSWVRTCSKTFLPSYLPIVERRKELPFSEQEKRWQQLRRGRYVEFNLMYDLGTAFGLRSGGRTESIFVSLPPMVAWEYDRQPKTGSREEEMLSVLKHPKKWVA